MPERALTEHEHEVLEEWLRHDSPHAPGLQKQLQSGLRAERNCECGCGSISLHLRHDASRHRVDINGAYPIEALLQDPTTPGRMILFLRDGLLDHIDVFSFGDQPAKFPAANGVRFGGHRGGHVVLPFDQELSIRTASLGSSASNVQSHFSVPGADSAAFAAITSLHDEYDRSSGHIGPLRRYLQLFDRTGVRLQLGFLDADSTEEILRMSAEIGISAEAWLESEQLLGEDGSLTQAALDEVHQL